MNGRPLEPDHGFPVRMIIPGQIGGRSVKVLVLVLPTITRSLLTSPQWLKRIEISAVESQHHLHYFGEPYWPTLKS